jgi:polyisoprenoid-binding protein YceI
VAFTVRHLMVSKVRGHFTRFQGELALAPDPLTSSVTATIELASIDTNNPQRDDDLRSANFFETDTLTGPLFLVRRIWRTNLRGSGQPTRR